MPSTADRTSLAMVSLAPDCQVVVAVVPLLSLCGPDVFVDGQQGDLADPAGIAGHNRSLQTPGQASRGRLPGVPSLDERVISQHSRKRRGSQEALGPHEKDEGSRRLRFLDAHEPGVRRPVTAVGRIRIQNGRSSALAHGYRPSWLSRPISVSSSTTSARPLTNTLHPDCVRSS